MTDEARIKYFRLVAIIGSIAAVVLVISTFGSRCAIPDAGSFGRRCGDPFTNWLYDYQTLITGALAVVAAAITVRTMNKNTRDVVYAEWKLLVYNVEFHALMLRGCVDTVRKSVINNPPNGLDRNEWKRFLYGASVSLRKVRDILVGAQQQGLNSYSLGSIANEIEQIDNCRVSLQSFVDGSLRSPWPLSNAELDECKRHFATVQRMLVLVEEGTQFAFDVFVLRSKTHNPMKFEF